DPGGAAPLEVSWKSDADRARSDASQTQIETGSRSGVLSQQHSPGVPSGDHDPELLPEEISGVMDPLTDNVCPHWDSTTRAKEMIVYLTGAVKLYADSNRAMLTNSRNAPPAVVAAINRDIQANEFHVHAMTACRDTIAQQLGMSSAAVERLTEYNTLTAAETEMFSEMSSNYSGQPNYFSKLLAMSDQRKALHLIDLELKDLNFELKQFPAMIDKDAGTPREETDQEILSRETSFRKALLAVRTAIAKKLSSAAPQG
ncbi:MAG: hypothetical protein ABSH33_24565, partial [Steroidobacteraceae bacterium]